MRAGAAKPYVSPLKEVQHSGDPNHKSTGSSSHRRWEDFGSMTLFPAQHTVADRRKLSSRALTKLNMVLLKESRENLDNYDQTRPYRNWQPGSTPISLSQWNPIKCISHDYKDFQHFVLSIFIPRNPSSAGGSPALFCILPLPHRPIC